MLLKNASVLFDDFIFRKADVRIENGKIAELGDLKPQNDEVLRDLSGHKLIPGLVETHFHGAMGKDSRMARHDVFASFAEYEASEGITSFVPGLAASPDECVERFLNSGIEYMKSPVKGAKMQGFYLEGPFIAVQYRGGHQPDALQLPSEEKMMYWHKLSQGKICKITVAPELKGAQSLIRWASTHNISVEMGHTGATYDQALRGIDWGASVITHVFNAMVPLYHRQPGILGAALTNENVVCELIADFGHVAPAIVKIVYLCKGADKINIISDSCVAAGVGDGHFETADGRPLLVKNGIARMPNGVITGSACSIMAGVRNLLKLDIPLEDAVKMASLNPAKTIKKDSEIGSIAKGKCADLVWLDEEINVCGTMVDGEIVYSRS